MKQIYINKFSFVILLASLILMNYIFNYIFCLNLFEQDILSFIISRYLMTHLLCLNSK